ncbi:amylo-alpha-1,6-glucosidase [Moorella sp. Hama-1]|uniref:amylo-alpha-1,6-glucosidase n=1 Tax=Moorella sp. Hama-1 TaxID=2138101 RepID=UPI000D6530DB|nr:glycogen debranching N-terminal domain-containing protein [Moorella sp. Hama-1]BCV21527.1 amylo-alpha-1,6-glucosidase [Moorella sp. Hama-1]
MLDTELDLRNNPCAIEPATEVLKEGGIFLVSLPDGSVIHRDNGSLGLYYNDTRYLSHLELQVAGQRPVFLSSSIRDSHFAQIELTNPVFNLPDGTVIPAQTIHFRQLRLIKDALFQRLRLINFNPFPVKLLLRFDLAADFRDIFEVRGSQRRRRGELLPVEVQRQGLVLAYRGLDNLLRTTGITFEPAPASITGRPGQAEITFALVLPPQKKLYLHLKIEPAPDNIPSGNKISDLFSAATIEQATAYHQWQRESTRFWTDNSFINAMFQTAVTDLKALQIEYPGTGRIIAAGIPWYTAPFGRDSLIASWQALILNPALAHQALRFLARYQGQKVDRWREERPGKILHELRQGEMTSCREVPHSPYYGSIDATLWFIILLGATYRWTRDDALLRELAIPLRNCLHWCLDHGDLDGDGYLEYQRESPAGLANQGWKDSWDAVVDREGRLAEGPVALVEVQAYYYLALNEAAHLLAILGDELTAADLKRRARELQERFNRDFWLEDEGYLIFALDGRKRPLTTLVSNGGQALFTGILPPERARRVARRLLAGDFYSGWGIRTMSKREKAYNPMSYHNGSVWPHDNAIIAAGLRRYQCLEELSRLAAGLFAASPHFNYRRWPELFCGFTRRGLSGPVRYPVACDPQAWAVGSLFSFLQHLLGLELGEHGLFISRPLLLPGTSRIEIRNLAVAGSRLDLAFEEKEGRVLANVLKKEGDLKVIIEA